MFDWASFLDLGRSLAEKTDDEAAARSAVSRAYYAAFHHAKSYLVAHDENVQVPRDGSSHERVPELLKRAGRTRAEISAATKLERLKKLRRWADYEPSSRERLMDEVEQAMKYADFIVNNLSLPSTT